MLDIFEACGHTFFNRLVTLKRELDSVQESNNGKRKVVFITTSQELQKSIPSAFTVAYAVQRNESVAAFITDGADDTKVNPIYMIAASFVELGCKVADKLNARFINNDSSTMSDYQHYFDKYLTTPSYFDTIDKLVTLDAKGVWQAKEYGIELRYLVLRLGDNPDKELEAIKKIVDDLDYNDLTLIIEGDNSLLPRMESAFTPTTVVAFD